jgi:hypothetical protein
VVLSLSANIATPVPLSWVRAVQARWAAEGKGGSQSTESWGRSTTHTSACSRPWRPRRQDRGRARDRHLGVERQTPSVRPLQLGQMHSCGRRVQGGASGVGPEAPSSAATRAPRSSGGPGRRGGAPRSQDAQASRRTAGPSASGLAPPISGAPIPRGLGSVRREGMSRRRNGWSEGAVTVRAMHRLLVLYPPPSDPDHF